MSHTTRIVFLALLFGALSVSALADSETFQATINTSGQTGNYGYLDLELNPGSLSGFGPVTLTISDFTGAALNPSDPNNDEMGTASGSLPGPLILNNSGFNDYYEGMTFGSEITFDATLSGSGVSLSGGAPFTSGTTFAAVFCDATCSNNLFVSDATTGAAVLLNVGANGAITTAGPVMSVPEQGRWPFLLSACAAMLLAFWRRRALLAAKTIAC